jgi:putative acyl-CoA dehydrogenase
MRLCRAIDLSWRDPAEAARARLLIPAAKYWVCRSAPVLAYEAMECLGGNGYVEDGMLARLYREAPVNAIWEGSGNVMCLDVLRAFARNEDVSRDVVASLQRETAELPGAAESIQTINKIVGSATAESDARMMVERLALVLAAAALKSSAPAAITEMFARARLSESRSTMCGSAQFSDAEQGRLLDRAVLAA